ncbi:MAG: T9SS type A sorting domain-containing protein [Bacteroidota bacterium]|nr:T9SS type A sorting domain-containing protein [Bacteroidota bacterium]MDP4259316.1 T9SS type A sorting domain-containing protein [Bacteroidota bacterium]
MTKFLGTPSQKYLFPALCTLLLSANAIAQDLTLVKEVNPTGSSFPHNFTVCAGKLYFIAMDNTNFNTVWVTSGTDATTQRIGPITGVSNSIQNLVTYNNKLFFSFDDGSGTGQELWASDGTEAGTSLLADLNPGTGNSTPQVFTVCNGKLFFAAVDNTGLFELYVSDGTPGGTVGLRHVNVLGGSTNFAALGNSIYFISDNGSGSGNGLWKTDGTPGGTVLLKPDIVAVTAIPGFSAVLNDKLYFQAADAVAGNELWVSDGTSGGTQLVKDIGISVSGDPQDLCVYNNKIYFAARDDDHGIEMWVTDGTGAGTQLFKDIAPGSGSSQPRQSVVYNGLLYFTCWGTSELWKTDGTDAGTQLVKSGMDFPKVAAQWNNKLYYLFGASNIIWESDGTSAGTKLFQPENTTNALTTYTDFGSDDHFTEYNSELYLNGQSLGIASGFEPVKLTSLNPLPLTFVDLRAEWISNGQANVSWVVASQENVNTYTVQHSADAVHYSDACRVVASTAQNYHCTVPAGSRNYFRVVETDLDGKQHFSKVISLQATAPSATTVFPNPATDILNIKELMNYQSAQAIDLAGRVVQQYIIGYGETTLNITSLGKGIYALKLFGRNESRTVYFIKN